jgi:hypothetical protein
MSWAYGSSRSAGLLWLRVMNAETADCGWRLRGQVGQGVSRHRPGLAACLERGRAVFDYPSRRSEGDLHHPRH